MDNQNDKKRGQAKHDSGENKKSSKPKSLNLTLSNFICGYILADGSSATIVEARTVRGSTARVNIPDKDIVLKSIPKFEVSQKTRLYLHREIEVHMRIGSHPNIATLYASFEDDHGIYLVLERIYGPTLHRVIRKNGLLTEKFTLQIIDQLLEAICFMHARGFSHRDISSKNIMFREWPSPRSGKLHVLLIDMGHACYRDPEADIVRRFSTEKIGTKHFIAPEVHSDPMYIPESCDMWSIGVLMYMMLTGEYPFVAETDEEMVQLTFGKLLHMKGGTWERVSNATKDIIRRLLRPVPYMRPDADCLKREVHGVLRGKPIGSPVEKPYRERMEYERRNRRQTKESPNIKP